MENCRAIIPGVRLRPDGRYEVYGSGPKGHFYLGMSPDLFEAVCIRKSYEAAWAAIGIDKTQRGLR